MDCLEMIGGLMADAVYNKFKSRKYGFDDCVGDDADCLFDLYELYDTAIQLSEEDLSLCLTCDELGEIIKTL